MKSSDLITVKQSFAPLILCMQRNTEFFGSCHDKCRLFSLWAGNLALQFRQSDGCAGAGWTG